MLPLPLAVPGPSVTLNPDPTQLPGASVLEHLADGIGGWALIAAVLGVVVGAVMWAFGHYSQNCPGGLADLHVWPVQGPRPALIPFALSRSISANLTEVRTR
jgi:hypothetical protein